MDCSGFRELKVLSVTARVLEVITAVVKMITGPFSTGGEQNKSMAMKCELYYCSCCHYYYYYPYISDKAP